MPAPDRIAVAMSGGVDSSVAAALLRRQGFEVIGLTMRLAPRRRGDPGAEARAVAGLLGIAHRVIDLEADFERQVVAPFVESYLGGRTPNPCVVCNREIKFGSLLRRARALGASVLASGHYCRREEAGGGRVRLRRAASAARDQSYFLFSLSQSQLSRVRFPLGEYSKGQVREIAAELGLPAAGGRESQEICFVEDGDHAGFVARRRSLVDGVGEIVKLQGATLGRHDGVHRYTVGQRRGLGIPSDRPLYVVALDPARRRVVVGRKEDLDREELEASGVNWVSIAEPGEPIRVEAKIRSRSPCEPATVEPLPGRRALVRFDAPQRGVAPGQAVVFYRDDLLLGGGWIENTRADLSAGA